MTETSVNKIEAQAAKKVKGAKTSKTPAVWMTLNRARRKFYQQLKATQNNATKIACIDEIAQEVYKSDHKMVWYDLLKESKRLTNLIDFNEYCHSLQRNPAFVAQHVAFEVGIKALPAPAGDILGFSVEHGRCCLSASGPRPGEGRLWDQLNLLWGNPHQS